MKTIPAVAFIFNQQQWQNNSFWNYYLRFSGRGYGSPQVSRIAGGHCLTNPLRASLICANDGNLGNRNRLLSPSERHMGGFFISLWDHLLLKHRRSVGLGTGQVLFHKWPSIGVKSYNTMHRQKTT